MTSESMMREMVRLLGELISRRSSGPATPLDTPLAYTPEHAAWLLDVEEGEVWAMIRRGELRTCRIAGKVHVSRAELERIAESAPDAATAIDDQGESNSPTVTSLAHRKRAGRRKR
jgi:hypothetical protein